MKRSLKNRLEYYCRDTENSKDFKWGDCHSFFSTKDYKEDVIEYVLDLFEKIKIEIESRIPFCRVWTYLDILVVTLPGNTLGQEIYYYVRAEPIGVVDDDFLCSIYTSEVVSIHTIPTSLDSLILKFEASNIRDVVSYLMDELMQSLINMDKDGVLGRYLSDNLIYEGSEITEYTRIFDSANESTLGYFRGGFSEGGSIELRFKPEFGTIYISSPSADGTAGITGLSWLGLLEVSCEDFGIVYNKTSYYLSAYSKLIYWVERTMFGVSALMSMNDRGISYVRIVCPYTSGVSVLDVYAVISQGDDYRFTVGEEEYDIYSLLECLWVHFIEEMRYPYIQDLFMDSFEGHNREILDQYNRVFIDKNKYRIAFSIDNNDLFFSFTLETGSKDYVWSIGYSSSQKYKKIRSGFSYDLNLDDFKTSIGKFLSSLNIDTIEDDFKSLGMGSLIRGAETDIKVVTDEVDDSAMESTELEVNSTEVSEIESTELDDSHIEFSAIRLFFGNVMYCLDSVFLDISMGIIDTDGYGELEVTLGMDKFIIRVISDSEVSSSVRIFDGDGGYLKEAFYFDYIRDLNQSLEDNIAGWFFENNYRHMLNSIVERLNRNLSSYLPSSRKCFISDINESPEIFEAVIYLFSTDSGMRSTFLELTGDYSTDYVTTNCDINSSSKNNKGGGLLLRSYGLDDSPSSRYSYNRDENNKGKLLSYLDNSMWDFLSMINNKVIEDSELSIKKLVGSGEVLGYRIRSNGSLYDINIEAASRYGIFPHLVSDSIVLKKTKSGLWISHSEYKSNRLIEDISSNESVCNTIFDRLFTSE